MVYRERIGLGWVLRFSGFSGFGDCRRCAEKVGESWRKF